MIAATQMTGIAAKVLSIRHLRATTQSIRKSHRLLSSDQAPMCGHGRVYRRLSIGRLLRGLGRSPTDRQTPPKRSRWRSSYCGDSARFVLQRRHSDPRRYRLHVGAWAPPLFAPRQTPRIFIWRRLLSPRTRSPPQLLLSSVQRNKAMRAVVLPRFGAPEVFVTEDVATPTPAADQMLVRVAACGVCGHDLLNRSGHFPHTHLPAVMGHEIAGTVVETGSLVTKFKPGDRVAVIQRIPCGHLPICAAPVARIYAYPARALWRGSFGRVWRIRACVGAQRRSGACFDSFTGRFRSQLRYRHWVPRPAPRPSRNCTTRSSLRPLRGALAFIPSSWPAFWTENYRRFNLRKQNADSARRGRRRRNCLPRI